jgi:hypothetical protein
VSYDVSETKFYSWPNDATFGATTITPHQIVGPPGKVGFVRDIEVDVTTTLVGTTTVPEVQVGIAASDFTYGRYRLGFTAIAGYTAPGRYSARNEIITGNPPRVATDYAGHVVLDGGPLSLSGIGIPGGSFSTQAPLGRIPASGRPVINATAGTGGTVVRLYLRDPIDPQILVGQTVNVRGLAGATIGGNSFVMGATISALSSNVTNPANPNYIELTGTTFGGTYTGGGVVDIVTMVTGKAGVGGTPAGGGTIFVECEWIGKFQP